MIRYRCWYQYWSLLFLWSPVFVDSATCLPAKDQEEKDELMRRAAENAENKRQRSSDAGHDRDNDNVSRTGFGVCGLGDMKYPINHEMFAECGKRTGFCTNMANAWASQHGECVACNAIEPKENRNQRKQCDEFCRVTGLIGKCPLLVDSVGRLLDDITRMLKGMYKTMKKGLSDPLVRHPVLFARWVSQNEQTERVAAWLISFACFKPFRLDAIRLVIPEQKLCPPFFAELEILPVYKGNELKTFNFASTKRIATEIAGLNPTQDPNQGSLQYAFNVAYRIDWRYSLTRLKICGSLTWVSLGVCNGLDDDPENDSENNDSDSDHSNCPVKLEQELSDLLDLVGDLTGEEPSAKKGAAKRKATKSSKSKDLSGPLFLNDQVLKN